MASSRTFSRALGALCLACALPLGCTFSDVGTGTHSLEVVVKAAYSATNPDRNTAVSVDVKKGGVAAPSPNIVLKDVDTAETFNINQTRGPTWVGNVPGYRRHLEVRIESGSDNLTCQIESPGRHTIGSPLQGESHRVVDGLLVTWRTTDGLKADEVDVSLENENYGPTTIVDDTGSFTVLPSILRPGNNDKVTVVRRNKLVPAGGTGNSLVQVEYGVSVEFSIN